MGAIELQTTVSVALVAVMVGSTWKLASMIQALRTEIVGLRGELKTEIADLRGEVRTGFGVACERHAATQTQIQSLATRLAHIEGAKVQTHD